jgi:hypothetical protein
MNQINVKRLLLAGLAMFVAWVALEILVEGIGVDLVFGRGHFDMASQTTGVEHWSAMNQVVNIALALLNTTLMMWLYASLRPMYGVGVRTALITSVFGLVLVLSLIANLVNLGLFPFRDGLIEAIFETIEFPIAMIVGAEIYEGKREEVRETA